MQSELMSLFMSTRIVFEIDAVARVGRRGGALGVVVDDEEEDGSCHVCCLFGPVHCTRTSLSLSG